MHAKKMTVVALFLCMGALFQGCDQEPGKGVSADADREKETPVEKITDGGVLRFYNWEDYTGEHTLAKFTEATSIDVDLQTFEDDEAILGALQSGAIEADLIVVSESMAREMQKAKLLQAVDYGRIANSEHIKPEYIPEADENNNRYWVPYLWGYTGLAVNTKYITGDYHSWSVLWDEQYANRLAMLNNAFETAAAAAKKLGYSVNPSPGQLEEVEHELLAQKKLLVGYLPVGEIMERLRDESIWAAQIYNGDGMVVAEENENIEFVTPREGTALWRDVFIIPRGAAHPELAHVFIDFIHTPEILADIASEYWYASTNKAAERYMSPEVLEAREVYPSAEVLAKSEFFGDMGSGESVRRRVQIWSMLTSKR